jgi:hypothetical protein
MIEIKSSLVHDINTVQDTINNINTDVKKKINIIGDKGYINSRIFEHKNKVVNVIYPRKSNQTRTCALHKKKLKNRYKIEHLFKNLNKYNRVYLKKEKDIKYYMLFVYLAMITEYKKIKTQYLI